MVSQKAQKLYNYNDKNGDNCHISGNQTQCKAQEINHDQRGCKMQQEHLNQMSGYTIM